MVPAVIWVLLPLLLYAVGIAVWRGHAPSRLAPNVQTSLLLIGYLLTTASLGVFWVANQQLPVFDLHYLLGYATLLLVTVHLVFNLPTVLHWLRGKPHRPPARYQSRPRPVRPRGRWMRRFVTMHFRRPRAAALIGVDSQRQWVLHFAALGLPAEAQEARR